MLNGSMGLSFEPLQRLLNPLFEKSTIENLQNSNLFGRASEVSVTYGKRKQCSFMCE